jgi:hypothetical protein
MHRTKGPHSLPVMCWFFPGGVRGFPLFHKVIPKGFSYFLLSRAFVTQCQSPFFSIKIYPKIWRHTFVYDGPFLRKG